MADDVQAQGASPKNEPTHVETTEDAETRATRRELKQSSISDQANDSAEGSTTGENRTETPDLSASEAKNEELKDHITSPKKKRAHDQLDRDQVPKDNDATSVTSTDSSKDRATRLEPEKKRHRDGESADPTSNPSSLDTKTGDQTSHPSISSIKPTQETSASAFASSGFGKLASGSSGFASLGSSQGSGFASAKPALSSFASAKSASDSVGTATSADKSQATASSKQSFGSKAGLSPFAGLSSGTNGLGGSGFGSLSGMKPLGTFAAAGAKPMQSEKAAKPFGAPDSDADEEEEEEDDNGDDEGQSGNGGHGVSPEKEVVDDKKRPKLHKVEVDSGETGEVTVLSVRAKMFSLDKEAGWKERGAGMLKINVPQASVEFDDAGIVIPGSFDASALEVDEQSGDDGSNSHKVARLILRQDQTHRVLLNTAILPVMEFQQKASLKSVGVLFTAFEGEDATAVTITMKMTAANSKLFLNEVGAIQRELRGS